MRQNQGFYHHRQGRPHRSAHIQVALRLQAHTVDTQAGSSLGKPQAQGLSQSLRHIRFQTDIGRTLSDALCQSLRQRYDLRVIRCPETRQRQHSIRIQPGKPLTDAPGQRFFRLLLLPG